MPSVNKRLLRLALVLHAAFSVPNHQGLHIELSSDSWDRCTVLVRQIRRARLRNWRLAANALHTDLKSALVTLADEIATVRERLRCGIVAPYLASHSDIYQDLLAIKEEFEELDYDCCVPRISVTTQPIVLEGVFLGPFEIRLQCGHIGRGDLPTYRVIAKEPHPAEGHSGVTHPHIQDEVLCEGDGKHAIRQALAQGRLFDFFLLVNGVLRTYNADSAFVELALWNGCSCSDCGAVVDEENCYECQKCQTNICGRCGAGCCRCEESYCSECIGSCAACIEHYCPHCLKTCESCQADVCAGCLDVHQRCPNCHEDDSANEVEINDEVDSNAAV